MLFRLQSPVTPKVLVVFAVLEAVTLFFVNAIDCIAHGRFSTSKLVRVVCWRKTSHVDEVGHDDVHLNIVDLWDLSGTGGFVLHDQFWLAPCWLLLQALMLSAPCILWRILEGGVMENLVTKLKTRSFAPKFVVLRRKMQAVVCAKANYVRGRYALKFFICKLLAFHVTILQMFATSYVINSAYHTFGRDVLSFALGLSDDLANTLHVVFPTGMSCFVLQSDSDLQHVDVYCSYPLNVFFAYVFLATWLWFAALSFVSGLSVLSLALSFTRASRKEDIRNLFMTDDEPCITELTDNLGVEGLNFMSQLAKHEIPRILHFQILSYIANINTTR